MHFQDVVQHLVKSNHSDLCFEFYQKMGISATGFDLALIHLLAKRTRDTIFHSSSLFISLGHYLVQMMIDQVAMDGHQTSHRAAIGTLYFHLLFPGGDPWAAGYCLATSSLNALNRRTR